MTQPLRGLTIVVTRPRAQASRLAGWIAEQGGEPLIFPLLEISPVIDPAPLQAVITRLGNYSLAVFISPNAVDFSVPAILAKQAWPSGLQAAAIGQSSVALLARYGIDHALAPVERFDSEALLELPEMQRARVAGKRVLILRGNGGRELLADTLRERGAEVDAVSCYQRSAPADAAPLQALWRSGRLDALTISSSRPTRLRRPSQSRRPARCTGARLSVRHAGVRAASAHRRTGAGACHAAGDPDRSSRCRDHRGAMQP